MRHPAGTAAGLIITAIVLLAGCGGAPAGTASSPAARPAGAGNAVPAAPLAGPASGQHAAGSGASRSGSAGQRQGSGNPLRLAPAAQAIVYTASMTVRVRDVSRAAALATQIAGQAGGYVSQENAALRSGRAASTASIQLKIPVAAYPAALAALARLGAQTSLRQQAQDVTQQVADTASRVVSDQAAITQLRALLSRAGSVGALLAVQDQINAQESDLEAMLAQQRALDRQTVYATVSLQLAGPVLAKHARKHRAKRAGGFVGGLTAGWKALVTAVSWLARAIGAALPIAAACALAGYLGYRILRGRRWLQRRGAKPRGA